MSDGQKACYPQARKKVEDDNETEPVDKETKCETVSVLPSKTGFPPFGVGGNQWKGPFFHLQEGEGKL